MSIPTDLAVTGFVVDVSPLELTSTGIHLVRLRVGNHTPTPASGAREDGSGRGRVFFSVHVYGDAAQRVSRRFRKGDTLIASGRIQHTTTFGPIFVAEHIGHDTRRTTYTVTRTRTARRRESGRASHADTPRGETSAHGGLAVVPASAARPTEASGR